MKVSIVIPVYNEAARLAVCLRAIERQTARPYEVIVVDNNSTDGSTAIAEQFSFVKVVHEASQGIIYARNRGFDAASGDVIARIDADIEIPANWVEYVAAFYDKPDNVKIAWTGSGFFYNVRFPRLVSAAYSLLAFRLNQVLLGYATLWGSNMAITRVQWQAVRSDVCVRTDIHEDLDLAIHLSRAGFKVHYDTSIKTNAQLKRVRSNRHELWEYLQWWPRTLRVHGRWNWLVCWLLSVLPLYVGAQILVVAEWMAVRFGRRPLDED
jgi:glycosyltransferase involved in cell wall biosynthesis